MPTVYALKCDDGCYFIGQSNKEYIADVRQHFKRQVPGWTQLHTPIQIDFLRFFCDERDVDMFTRAYMYRYGIDKVRGGSYTNTTLTLQQLREIELSQYEGFVVCHRCQINGHNYTKCPFATDRHVEPFQIETLNPQSNWRESAMETIYIIRELYTALIDKLRGKSRISDLFIPIYTDADIF